MGTFGNWWGVVLRLDYLNSYILRLFTYLDYVWLSRILVCTLVWLFDLACGLFHLRSVDRA